MKGTNPREGSTLSAEPRRVCTQDAVQTVKPTVPSRSEPEHSRGSGPLSYSLARCKYPRALLHGQCLRFLGRPAHGAGSAPGGSLFASGGPRRRHAAAPAPSIPRPARRRPAALTQPKLDGVTARGRQQLGAAPPTAAAADDDPKLPHRPSSSVRFPPPRARAHLTVAVGPMQAHPQIRALDDEPRARARLGDTCRAGATKGRAWRSEPARTPPSLAEEPPCGRQNGRLQR
eukprot:scaffold137_cov398-Prasinococcus_capsulatus_cf.AAC.3